jgi:monoamine oxidase
MFPKFFFLACMSILSNTGFSNEKEPTVVIVGAGIAGLTTAYRLHQKGINVQLYEAKNRVGGRIFSVKMGSHIGELGGQNINDGGKAENMRRLIDEFHLELTKTRVNLNHHYFDGETLISLSQFIQTEFDLENLQSRLELAAQKSKNMREVMDQFFNPEDLIYKSLSVRMAAYEGAPPVNLSPLYVETLYYMILGGISAVHQCDEEKYIDLESIREGNAILTDKLAETLQGRVHVNRPLAAVSKTPSGAYELLFKNGEKTLADILVLAIPCSVYSDIDFEEGVIPEERLTSIQNVKYGTNAKILIPFSQPPKERITFVNDRTIGFFNGDLTVLTRYYTGESGKIKGSTNLKNNHQDRPKLELGFGADCPSLETPVIGRDASLASYEGAVGYSWPNDPYAKGSYSYIAAGQESLLTTTHREGDETVKTLFAPIHQTLYFTGEHATILMHVPGTMEAACESGERTARMIEKSFR